MPTPIAASRSSAEAIDPELSRKLHFWSLMAMVLLVYVHAFNLQPRYLQPMTLVEAPATWDNVMQYLFANGLLRFRIPILFAISGYLFARRDTGAESHRSRLSRRAKTLGIPYLAWSAIAIAFTCALEQWSSTRELVRSAALSPFQPEKFFVDQYSVGQLFTRWLLIPAAFQLWFLRTLLLLTALYPWLRTAVTRWPRASFIAATLYWIPGDGVPFLESEGLLFYALGVWLASTNVDVMQKPAWLRIRVMVPTWLLLCGVKTWMAFVYHDYSGPQVLVMTLLHRASEVAGLLVGWYGIDALIRSAMARAWFRGLTGLSFMIYALHVPMVNYATEAALKYGTGIPHLPLLTYLVVPLAVIAVAVVLGVTMRTVARPVYSVLTGGRGL